MATYDLTHVRSRKELWHKKPDWIIHYVEGRVVDAHTHGLDAYGQVELQVRKLDQQSAVHILNLIGAWVAGGHGRIVDGDTIIIGAKPHNVDFLAHASIDEQGEPVLRLAWTHDP